MQHAEAKVGRANLVPSNHKLGSSACSWRHRGIKGVISLPRHIVSTI